MCISFLSVFLVFVGQQILRVYDISRLVTCLICIEFHSIRVHECFTRINLHNRDVVFHHRKTVSFVCFINALFVSYKIFHRIHYFHHAIISKSYARCMFAICLINMLNYNVHSKRFGITRTLK